MMASSDIMTCLNSALHDADWWVNNKHFEEVDFKEMRIALRTLKTFVFCARKLHNRASSGSLVLQIDDFVRENAEKLHACCLGQMKSEGAKSIHDKDFDKTFSSFHGAKRLAIRFKEFIEASVDEINKWYLAVLSTCSVVSSSLTAHEILEIMADVIENIAYQRSLKNVGNWVWWMQHEEQGKFLKSLIQFTNLVISSEAFEHLLANAEQIAIKFAYLLCWTNYGTSDSSTEWLVIKPVDPRVYWIYTEALTSSKLSGLLPESAAMKNFLDSVISNVWEILLMKTLSKKDQLQEFYQGLRSLRYAVFLKQPTTSFGKHIADLVCDAGIYICSFYQNRVDDDLELRVADDLELPRLLDILETILVEVGDKDVQIFKLNSPKPSSYAYVDFILEKLMEMTGCEAESTAKTHVETIQEELASVRSLLGKVVELQDEEVEIQTLWDRLLEVAYEVEDEIDHQHSFSTSFDSIMKCLSNVKADVLKIEVKDVTRPSNSLVISKSERTPSMPNEVIGFRDEERRIIDRLRRGSQHLEIISVVGMPGSGKTTLATKVFNNPSISRHFSTSAWCPISQALDKRRVLLDLLKQVCPKTDDFAEMTEDDLANKLRQSLKGKRYLIYLDDIWNLEAWYGLKDSFPDDSKQSRIILTTRSHEMLDKEPVILSELSIEDSMELLQRRLFPGESNAWPAELHDLGVQMAEKCKGLPLSIVVLSGVLANVEVEDWKKILDGFSFVSNADYCKHTLELSHKHLPDYLKPCLLYFGAFPEDKEIKVKKLLRLWIAEGFVRKSKTKSLEEVAEDYLRALIGRSLIMAAERRSDGGVKTCRIHDLLHDFCLQQSRDEHFFHSLKGDDELLSFNEPHNLRRLWIESEPEHIKGSKLICPRARSFHLSRSQESRSPYRGISGMLHFCKLLKVLDLEQIKVPKFPSVIRQLVLLAFLAINGQDNMDVPSWIDDLSRLESFIIIHHNREISFPSSIWYLQRLKYLYTSAHMFENSRLPRKYLRKSPILYELERVSGAAIHWGCMERQLRKFPNVRKLKCRLVLDEGDYANYPAQFVFPDFLTRLEALSMQVDLSLWFTVGFSFASLANLKMLKLSGFQFRREMLTTIGEQLPDLEVLKLETLHIHDGEDLTWEMKEGEFAKLRILHLSQMEICRWTTCHDHEFECFQKLVLNRCNYFKELPSCLGSIETLEMIEVHDCKESVQNLAVNIKKAQEDWGNEGMMIKIRN